ncbi:MAG: type II secretion system protein GspM, partial [Acidiferrobacterales bacterium]
LGGFLFYDLLWAPVEHDLHELRVEVPRDRARLTIMRAQALQVSQLRAGGMIGHASSGAILATLEQSAASYGLKQALTQMEPDGTSGARLVLQGVAFNTLVTWLNALQAHNGVRVESAAINAKATPGVVDAHLTLRGPGG